MLEHLVSDECMHRCVAAILSRDNEFHGVHPRYNDEAGTRIGRLLFDMNERALTSHHTFSPWQDFTFAGRSRPSIYYAHRDTGYLPGHPLQVIRSLQYFLDQCSEEGTMETGLFHDVRAVMGALSFEVVVTLPEYDRAEWG